MQIKLENVNYIYNPGSPFETRALSDVCLEIGGDSFIAVIGSTGSGKSTLIQLLNGLEKPSSGRILYDGEEIFGKKDEKKLLRELRCKVGLVFQYSENQLFEETVIKDVSYGPGNLGLDAKEIRTRAEEALELVGLGEEYYEKSPFELSGGEMRRVAIAGIIAMRPEILILDEPTAGLDPMGKKETLEMVKDIQRRKHITVVLVSHTMEEVARYADRVIAMNRSKIMLDLPVHEAFGHYKELEEIGLKAPEVKYFVEDLKAEGFEIDTNAITVDEAKAAVLAALKKQN